MTFVKAKIRYSNTCYTLVIFTCYLFLFPFDVFYLIKQDSNPVPQCFDTGMMLPTYQQIVVQFLYFYFSKSSLVSLVSISFLPNLANDGVLNVFTLIVLFFQ